MFSLWLGLQGAARGTLGFTWQAKFASGGAFPVVFVLVVLPALASQFFLLQLLFALRGLAEIWASPAGPDHQARPRAGGNSWLHQSFGTSNLHKICAVLFWQGGVYAGNNGGWNLLANPSHLPFGLNFGLIFLDPWFAVNTKLKRKVSAETESIHH